jgi:hypothetical protein
LRRFQRVAEYQARRFVAQDGTGRDLGRPGDKLSYDRPTIHVAPTTVSQTAIVATASAIIAASNAIDSKSPSSSR